MLARRKEEFSMFEIDYIIIKLKKKSSAEQKKS